MRANFLVILLCSFLLQAFGQNATNYYLSVLREQVEESEAKNLVVAIDSASLSQEEILLGSIDQEINELQAVIQSDENLGQALNAIVVLGLLLIFFIVVILIQYNRLKGRKEELVVQEKANQVLLGQIFPASITEEIIRSGSVTPKEYNDVVIGFVEISLKTTNKTPKEIIESYDYIYSVLDNLSVEFGIEKLKSSGKIYLAMHSANGKETGFTANQMVLWARKIQSFARLNKELLDVRIGLNHGTAVGGIMGAERMHFDIWGDAVNVAARCYQHSEMNTISLSQTMVDALGEENQIGLTSRGKVFVKNRGELEMYYAV